MLFPTITFAVFFLLVFVGNWLLMPRPGLWKWFMLVASYVFVWWAGGDGVRIDLILVRFVIPWPVLVLAVVTLLNQVLARLVHRSRVQRVAGLGPRHWLILAVAVNLAILGWFKYYGFFVTSALNFLDTVGLHADVTLLRIVLPLGLSFLVFRVLSYVIDIYRGTLRPAPLLDFALYVCFFPYLAAGPIARASEFLPQLAGPRDPRRIDTGRAFFLIFAGLVKKMLIADYLATHLVSGVFTTPGQYTSLEVLLGIVGYSVRIYCDFSAYSDIAIGVSLLLGFELPENFDRPYTAASVREFWRRWHMTLSGWLRDYLYIPLGGNRQGRLRTYVNLMITMLLGGLWHGAGWTFVFWGFLYGCALIVEHVRLDRRKDRAMLARLEQDELAELAADSRALVAEAGGGQDEGDAPEVAQPPGGEWPAAGGHESAPRPVPLSYDARPWRGEVWPRVGVFAFVSFAWIFFASATFGAAVDVILRLFQSWGAVGSAVTPGILLALAAGIGAQYVPRSLWERGEAWLSAVNPVVQGVVLAVGFMLLSVLGPAGVSAFIYFGF